MEPFDLAQSFIESAERAATTPELDARFQDALQRLGFRYFACCSHVDPLRPPRSAVMLHNYPTSWVDIFSERKLHEVDPVLLRAERSFLPFLWNSLDRKQLTTPQRRILIEGARFGLSNGYTIPLHSPCTANGTKASCSIVPDSRRVTARNYFAAQLIAMYFYAAAIRAHEPSRAPREDGHLSHRERQCLELAAQGKSDWAIGEILRISEHTVHRHIESAKVRLGVVTRVQAIMRALEAREMSFGDVIRSDLPSERSSARDRPA